MRKKTTISLRGSVELAYSACDEMANKLKNTDQATLEFFNANILSPLERAKEKIDKISESKAASLVIVASRKSAD